MLSLIIAHMATVITLFIFSVIIKIITNVIA
jgi:hypothetical protein